MEPKTTIMQRTLGGDRLGSGKKMKVDLHGYERSTHDLSYLWRSTMSTGTVVPFLKKIGLPGDTWDFDLNALINSHPTLGPVFGSKKLQLDVAVAPIRLYQAQLHNNKRKIGLKMETIKLPVIELGGPELDPTDLENIPDIDNAMINPSCLLKYLGISGPGIINPAAVYKKRVFHALFLLMYWDFYKNYYANQQENIGAVIHNEAIEPPNNVNSVTVDGGAAPQPLVSGSQIVITFAVLQPLNTIIFETDLGDINGADIGNVLSTVGLVTTIIYDFARWGTRIFTGTRYALPTDMINQINVETFPLDDIDTMREAILADIFSPNAFSVSAQNLYPYKLLFQEDNGFYSRLSSQEGLAIKTYQSDLFNNWLETETITGPNSIAEVTKIDVSGGDLYIDQLILNRKLYDHLNRIAVSGGTYDDWIEVSWDINFYKRCETPMYMGGLIKEILFQEVISNSTSNNDVGSEQPLGTLAGKGVLGKKHKGGSVTIKCDEPSIIMGFVSITPRLDYSQGNDYDTTLLTMNDLHQPDFDQIGFQDLVTDQMAYWSTKQEADSSWTTTSAGKQPAWVNWMTDVNKNFGNFAIANNEMFMVLNRRYEAENDMGTLRIKDLTTYIDPVKFNQIFAQTSLDSQNYWVQIAVDITCRRKMSAKLMPNL